ncbi:ABC transporter permease [Protofrankia sp. BMG5.30]|uniref:ABC transporter permease n=1 Tax=Protofrankia sp. BMG5.30 TaxID=1834514 RepID=UPI0009758D54|nr:ABC transporter permease [Protofrankia sp. BMG5.30]ONH33535.1 peptide ABC transporter permease [Protofrankia sp. BMG5.30]
MSATTAAFDTARPRWRATRGSHILLAISTLAVALIVALLLFPGVFAPYAPDTNDVQHTFSPPSSTHYLGTDQLGRDVFSRLVYGARYSVTTGLVATAIAVVAGSLVGLTAAAGSRLADALIMRLTDVWMAFPEVLLALLVIALIGTGSTQIAVAIGVAAVPYYGRLVRGQALAVTKAEYVEAAKILGVPAWRYVLRHVLPNVGGPVVVLASLGTGSAIAAAAGLSLLGLGPLPPTPEWGVMLAEGQTYLANAWWIAVFPGLAIVVVVLVSTTLGRSLQARSLR